MNYLSAATACLLLITASAAQAAVEIRTSDIEQTDSLTVCATEANAIALAKAWNRSWEEADAFLLDHSEDCDSVSMRQSIPYTIDLQSAHDGIVEVLGFPTPSTLWMPLSQASRDLFASFGHEYGPAEAYFGLEMYTPMDGLYSSAAQYRDAVAMHYVYLLAGKVFSLWYDPNTESVISMSILQNSSYDPLTGELRLEQPIINRTQTYRLRQQSNGDTLELQDAVIANKDFFPSRTLHRQKSGLIELDAKPGSRAGKLLQNFISLSTSEARP